MAKISSSVFQGIGLTPLFKVGVFTRAGRSCPPVLSTKAKHDRCGLSQCNPLDIQHNLLSLLAFTYTRAQHSYLVLTAVLRTKIIQEVSVLVLMGNRRFINGTSPASFSRSELYTQYSLGGEYSFDNRLVVHYTMVLLMFGPIQMAKDAQRVSGCMDNTSLPIEQYSRCISMLKISI